MTTSTGRHLLAQSVPPLLPGITTAWLFRDPIRTGVAQLVAVIYCSLRGTAMVLNRKIGLQILSSGVSGLLCQSDIPMHDHQTYRLALKQAVTNTVADTSVVVTCDPRTQQATVIDASAGKAFPSVLAFWLARQAFYRRTGLWNAE